MQGLSPKTVRSNAAFVNFTPFTSCVHTSPAASCGRSAGAVPRAGRPYDDSIPQSGARPPIIQ